ncbi:hypothetical protein C8Q75DRAFT_533357 [Abortiporus biennis]|nr:hypothetical protein C8Q75DRAFT_533357 [Abortiporus biennis]
MSETPISAAQQPILSPAPNSPRGYTTGNSDQASVLSRPFRPPPIPLPRTESPPSEELQTPFEETSEVSPPIPSGILPVIQSSTSLVNSPHGDTPPAVDNTSDITPTSNAIPVVHNDHNVELLVQFDREFKNETNKWESLFVNTEFDRTVTGPNQRKSQFDSLRKELHHQFGKEIQRFDTQLQERVKGWEASELAFEQQYADMTTYQQRSFREQMDQLRKSLRSERHEGDYFRKEQVHRIFERIEGQLLLAIQEHQGIFEEWHLYWKQQLKPSTQKTAISPPRLTTRGSGGPSTKLEPETQLSMRSLFRSVGGATRTLRDGAMKSASLGPTIFRQTYTTFQSNTQLNIQQSPHAVFMAREWEWRDVFADMMYRHNSTFRSQELEREDAFKLVFSVFTEKKESTDRKFSVIFESQLKSWDDDLSREAEIGKSKFETRMVEWEEQFDKDEKKRENEFALALREFLEAEAVDDIKIRTEFTRWTMEVNSKVEKEKLRWKEEFGKIHRAHEQIHTDLCLLANFPDDQSDSEEE